MQGSNSSKRRGKRSGLGSHHQERLLRGLTLDEQTSLHTQLELLRRGNQLGEGRGDAHLLPPHAVLHWRAAGRIACLNQPNSL
jgi:hypothetical protein